MTRWSVGLAVVVLAAGVGLLGTRWEGIEVAPGVWRDSVSLTQWAMLWVLLAIVALVAARRVPRWLQRLLVLMPLLAWIAWSLGGGTLTPLAFVIYAVPTLVVWCGGLALGDALRRR
jgi:hypothetical protein